MQRRRARFAVALACAAVLGAATMSNASATVARKPTVPSDRFCTSFGDYFQIVFQLQLVTAFASLGESKSKNQSKSTAEDARNLFLLVLSPKLERLTRQMVPEPKTHLRALFTKQNKSFRVAIDLLRGVGFTDKQLIILSKSPLDPSSAELNRVVGEVKATKAQMNAAAKKFGKQGVTLDLGTVGAKDQRAIARVGSACGTFPSPVDCATLVTSAEAANILGGPATKADSNGCGYDGQEPAVGTKPQLGFDVYTSARSFAIITKGTQNQNVPGIGDDAVALEGFKTFSLDSSCGKSLAVKDGDRVVVVAMCLADANGVNADVPVDTLVRLARQILARL
jgi:hypothetical protein